MKARDISSKDGQSAIIKEEISKFNPYCEQITYTTLGCFAGVIRAVLNDGPAGIGKSRSTVELSRMLLGIKTQVINGQVSPLAMYKLLYESRFSESVLIIDESFTLLADSQIQQMIRCALYSEIVDWRSQGNKFESLGLPESFKFKGRIIFNTNVTNHNDFNCRAMLDRVFYNRLILTGEQIALKMKSRRESTPNKQVWKEIEQRIIRIRNGDINIQLSTDEKNQILDYVIQRILEINRTYNANLSMRILERVETLCLFLKKFFGTLDFEFAKNLAKHYFIINDEEDFIKKVIAEAGGVIAAKDLATILSEMQRYSYRTAQRRIYDYVSAGKIETPKRGYVALAKLVPLCTTISEPPAPLAPRTPIMPNYGNSTPWAGTFAKNDLLN
jgi:hypothetical protein